MTDVTMASAGAGASAEQTQEILDWFARYDALVQAGDLEGMADLASFPLNEVTDDAAGHGLAAPCDRERYLAQMQEVVGGSGDLEMTSTRHPIFLSPALCFVVTDAVFVSEGIETQMRYGDLLMRTADGWKFQTMVAGGWHEQM
ncbi:hypothetical protein [Microbacterium sp. SA39]|uniref:hypothetical protein n=1 Tax=Microbacterium sp. SA39 TaxID=1263625 RepID=UPI0005F9BE47|nr:hypothetical protein [Microbacterium sp. SA39]KJQ55408.1 hypothetical protein RS85_00686 [Microbacterium sp. SA39]